MKPKIAEIRKENRALYATYHRFWNTPDGQIVWNDLMEMFNADTLIKGKDGILDPNASIAAAGSRKVLLYIEGMRNRHNATLD